MKSPVTGKNMVLRTEVRSLVFRKEAFPIVYHYYLCEDSGEQFTTTDIDELNMIQLYNQYREKHHLPFPDEIKAIREKYGLPANKMSEILGFGINSYRNYENGEVPSQANARLIQFANDPKKFKDLIALSDSLDEKAKDKLIRRIEQLIDQEEENFFSVEIQDYLLGDNISDEFSGYRKPSLERLTEMVVFFTEKLQPWKTKMNKLLFYADFLSFKKTCFSMSGARYRAIERGPVPNNYDGVFGYLANEKYVDIQEIELPGGYFGDKFKPCNDYKFNSSLFNEIELSVLDKVASIFKDISITNIIEISHREKAWIENEKERKIISYRNYAFDLSI